MRHRDLLLAVVAVVIAAAALLVVRWVRDEAPLAGRYKCPDCNVVLVSIDTLRADHLGCYGYHRPTSPNIDRFANDAVLFEQVVNTGGGTLPVHMSMFTSLPPIVHNVQPYNGRRLDAERITLAEQLKERGYTTAAFADGGWLRAQFGFDQGFDLYDDAGGGFRKIIPKVLAWIHTHREERFFLFVHTYDVHSGGRRLTYDPPEGFRGRFDLGYSGTFDGCRLRKCASKLLVWLNNHILDGKISGRNFFSAEELTYIVSLYDGAIAYADSEIGRLLDALTALDLYDRTLIIVTSDHGEEFLEHGLMLHWQNYEEQARVPLILKLPSSRVRRRRVPALVSTLEVMPTILDIVDVPPNGEVRGESMMPLLRGGTLRR